MMQVKYGDQPVYSQAFTHSCTQLTQHNTQTARLAAAQQHSCRSRCHPQSGPLTQTTGCVAPAPCPAATQGAVTSLSRKALSSTTSPHAGQSKSACCTVLRTQTTCSSPSPALAPSARMCSGSLLWPAQQACAGLPSPTARSKLPRTTALPAALRQLRAFLQAFQLLPLSLRHWLPVQDERQGRLSEFGLLLSSLLGAVVSLHIEMLLCPAFAAQGPPSSVARGPLCHLLLPDSGAQACA